jgi:thiol-disulfide isomerase/thioredoxin
MDKNSISLNSFIAVIVVIGLGACIVGPALMGKHFGMVGKQAPPIVLPELGRHTIIKLEDYEGKVVILDFWATWCPPCRKQMPILQRIQDDRSLAGRIMILSINMDEADEDRIKLVNNFMRRNNFTMTTLLDDGSAARAYRVSSIPTMVIVAPDGKIQHIKSGLHDEPELRRLIADGMKLQ